MAEHAIDSKRIHDEIPRRIWIDMTHTMQSGLNTGIQRVVRKLIENLPVVAEMQEIPCETVVFRDRCFQTTKSQNGLFATDYRQFRQQFSSRLPAWYKSSIQTLLQFARMRVLEKLLLPRAGKLGVFFLPIFIAFSLVTAIRWITRPLRKIRFRPGDILLMPDGYWVLERIWPGVADAKSEGAMIVVVVYDLISVTHPEFFVDGSRDKFVRYLDQVAAHADLVMAISQSVAIELKSTLDAMRPMQKMPLIRSFPLGADIESGDEPVRDMLLELLVMPTPLFLVAATIEPRKNHKVVLDAFDRMWQQSNEVRLLLVGRLGWLHDELLQRIQSHPEWNRRLYLWNDVNDKELSECYQRCSAVICPSHAEGFGLPITEALWYGKPVFVSDIPIHREVGKEDCIYFDKDDSEELKNILEDRIRNGTLCDFDVQDSRRRVVSWHESARELLGQLLLKTSQ